MFMLGQARGKSHVGDSASGGLGNHGCGAFRPTQQLPRRVMGLLLHCCVICTIWFPTDATNFIFARLPASEAFQTVPSCLWGNLPYRDTALLPPSSPSSQGCALESQRQAESKQEEGMASQSCPCAQPDGNRQNEPLACLRSSLGRSSSRRD